MIRTATIARATKETSIELRLTLADDGGLEGGSGIGFLDHMLDALCRHGRLALAIKATGDRHVDDHHLVEDLGICLGQALEQALGDKRGINRFGDATVPLDESLVMAVVDLSGRAHLSYDVPMAQERLGDFDTALFEEFFQALAANARMTLHLRMLQGGNSHHRIEAAFKAFARALRVAMAPDGTDSLPSTKGSLREAGSDGR